MGARGCHTRGFTLVELLVVIGIIAALTAILLPILTGSTALAYRARCANRQIQVYRALQMYSNDFEQHLPLAWHIGGSGAIQDDLANVAYWRFALHEYCETNFNHVVSSGSGPDGDATGKFERNRKFWEDPAKGATRDYFAPELVFVRGHTADEPPAGGPVVPTFEGPDFDGHRQISELIQDVSSSERPLLTDVYASWPNPDGIEDETKNGWQIDLTNTAGYEDGVFVGVGKSLRVDGDCGTGRFDFRHKKSANFLFLDGHAIAVQRSDQARLRRIHDWWDSLTPLQP